METEATAAGYCECDAGHYLRLQIITLAELFQGKRPRVPVLDAGAMFRTAAREVIDRQEKLDL